MNRDFTDKKAIFVWKKKFVQSVSPEKKIPAQAVGKKKKIRASWKFPSPPPPHHFSNGPSLTIIISKIISPDTEERTRFYILEARNVKKNIYYLKKIGVPLFPTIYSWVPLSPENKISSLPPCRKRSGLMSVLSFPERVVQVRALAGGHSTLTVPLSTHEYKWVPANCWGKPNKLRGSDLRWTSIPARGSRNTPSWFLLQKPG